MKKRGLSYGCLVLVCTVTSGLLVHVMKKMLPFLDGILHTLTTEIVDLLDLPFDSDVMSTALVAAVLASMWGAAFSLMRRG